MEGQKVEGYNVKSGKTVTRQMILALLTNISNIAPGMSIGFSAVAIPALNDFTSNQKSWFASIASLATPIGCLLSGPLADKFGRRTAIAAVNITALIGWMIVALAYYVQESRYPIILLGRFTTGLSAGLCGTPAAIYMAEVASFKMRSVFTTWVSLFYAIGIFVVYLLGLTLKDDWGTISVIAACFPLIGIFCLRFFIPESPLWLVTKQRFDEAKYNMCRLHGTKEYSQAAKAELEDLVQGGNVKVTKNATPFTQQFLKRMRLLRKRNFLRPYFLVLTFFFFQQFTGIFAIMFYAIDIVTKAKIQLDPYITIVIIALVRFIGMVLVSFISRFSGRRPMSLFSGFGIAITMLALGSYTMAVQQGSIDPQTYSSVPLILIIGYFFISTLGFYPIPFALASEVFPRNIRGTAAGISTATNFFFNFIIVKLYHTMVNSMGAHGVFYFFGTMGAIGTAFVWFCLPETRGKTLQEIQQYFTSTKEPEQLKA